MSQARERLSREDDAEQERLFNANLEAALDKLDLGISRRARMPPFTLDEMKALRQFYRKHS